MIRFYPIIRAFTSIGVALALLGFAPALYAVDATAVAAITFDDASGKAVFLKDYKGKAVLLNFWATWCAPCIAEMPALAALQTQYKDKGFVVLPVSEDDSIDDALKFFKTKSITAMAPFHDKDHAAWTIFKSQGLPTTVLIDRSGTAVKTIEGPVDIQSPDFQKALDSLISSH